MSSTLATCPNGHPVGALDTVCPHCGTLTQAEPLPPAPSLPNVLGYEILGVLGRGGMGVVYKARQISLDRIVALKMIRDADLAGADANARFRGEAQAIARLQHPHVVQIFEVGEHQGQPFFTLELVSGGSLAERLHGVPQSPQHAARLVETLARAVHAAHQQGVVHRDLKPANVLLTADGSPKVGDFGLAKRLDSSVQTQSGLLLGTPAYMSPEQAAGASRAIGPLSDVYALGALLYEMLTGKPPFLGETALDTIQQVITQEPVPPRQLQPKLPRALETICLKCLHKTPKKRYASAEALAEDLRRFAAGEPILARRAGTVERLAAWCRRRPAVSALTVSLIAAILAGFVGVTWKWREAEQHKQQAQQAEQLALRRERSTAEALTYVSASAIADTFAPLASDGKSLLDRIGKRPQALRTLQRACDLGEQLLDSDAHPRLLRALAEQYAPLAVLQAAAGQRAEARASCRRGAALLERLSKENKNDLGDPKSLAVTCYLLGSVSMILNEPDEAAPAFQQAIQHQRRVLEQDVKDRTRRKVLSNFYYHLAHVQLQAGRVDESAATARERRKLWPNDADEVYDVACELARCAAVKKGDDLSQRQQRRAYADESMSVLRQAVDLGLKNADAVRRDVDLKPLRGRDDFRKLLEAMEQRQRRK